MGSLANGRVIQVEIIANRTDDDLARVQPHAHLDRHAVGPLDLGGILVHGCLHGQGGIACPNGMIFMGNRRPEQRHDAIPHHLIDGPFIAMDRGHHALEDGVKQLSRLFRITVREEIHGPFKVGKEDGDLLALAFQSGARGQDLLGEVWRRIGERFWAWHSGWSRYRRGSTNAPSPHEHGTARVDRELLDLNELVLKILKERVVEGKLAPEGTVGHPAVLLHHRNRLAQDVIKRHGGSSACGLLHDGARMPLS
jgi:hypothetical protein